MVLEMLVETFSPESRVLCTYRAARGRLAGCGTFYRKREFTCNTDYARQVKRASSLHDDELSLQSRQLGEETVTWPNEYDGLNE